MYRFFVLLALITFVNSVSWSATTTLPIEVQKHIDEMNRSCKDAGGTPADPKDGFLVTADLNGDGLLDWAIDEGKFQCDGAMSIFSSSEGSQIYVYAGLPGNKAHEAFMRGAYEMRLEKSVGRARLWLRVGGALCGQAHPRSNADAIACDRPLVWNKATSRFEFAPLSTIKPDIK